MGITPKSRAGDADVFKCFTDIGLMCLPQIPCVTGDHCYTHSVTLIQVHSFDIVPLAQKYVHVSKLNLCLQL